MTKDRSDKFRAWIKEPTDEKIEKLVRMEKQVRLILHVWDLVSELDMKALHNLARVSHQIREEYEKSDE